MTIPLEEGFTVVTGPNGSGKSNILDGVLFCLGLATSRGMRADRLPDLVNSGVLREGKAAETVVSVRFDLGDWKPDPAEVGLEPPEEGPWIRPDQKEWIVTRRLRVMPGGSYSSSYTADGESCNLQQLQTQLRRLRIDPEGSNVVMQGDVTRIVSMSNRDRRGLIDELAGVALFDNRIEQTRSKLDDVYERQERCRIVEQELISTKQRLERDCAKARVYSELREKLQLGRKQELVLTFEVAQQSLSSLKIKKEGLDKKEINDQLLLKRTEENLINEEEKLKILQEEVKGLGEDKLIAVQASLAGSDTQLRELDRQAELHKMEGQTLNKSREDLVRRRQQINLDNQRQIENVNSFELENAERICKEAEAAVDVSRRRLGDVAGRSGAWLEDQKKLSFGREKIQALLLPLQQEQQKLEERIRQDAFRQKELESEQKKDDVENKQVSIQLDKLEEEWQKLLGKIDQDKKELQENSDSLLVQQRTRLRLEQEQTKLEKDIARLESRRETLQESRGASALRLLLESGLEGIHGPVAQLGEVEDDYRLALEVAAGSRLAQVVVDDDRIAAKAIELLKSRRAGRLTFLPLNRINSNSSLVNNALLRGRKVHEETNSTGLIARAVELLKFESIYKEVFSYVFGETLVFTDLGSARRHSARVRAVTLEGDLIEKSGAMTGGSFSSNKSFSLSFGSTNDRDEAVPLRKRLLEIGETLVLCRKKENLYKKSIEEANPVLRELEQRYAAMEAERTAAKRSNGPLLERQSFRAKRLKDLLDSQASHKQRLKGLNQEIISFNSQLVNLKNKENKSQIEGNSQNWKKLQCDLEKADSALTNARQERDNLLSQQREKQLFLERLADQKNALDLEENRLQEAVRILTNAHEKWKEQQRDLQINRKQLEEEQTSLQARLGEQRRARDAAEVKVSDQRRLVQQYLWNLDHLKEEREAIVEEIRSCSIRLNEMENSLPDPLPEISSELRDAGLEQLQTNLQAIQARMEALEPVNMLALEELGELEQRLGDLVEKLQILSQEREELLLRIETVATLRQEAFMEAFEAVDKHFREIFASLSDGDGHLQLDNTEDPLEGGLTLVAHPKGKSVRRLAAMSGGEKSLTALSFLFALQRFRPSPFYALDEVDSFLDGVNVERLAALIARQAEQAQFLVVSHRRPMIGASNRTIGVTQARGAHTQVVGLPHAA